MARLLLFLAVFGLGVGCSGGSDDDTKRDRPPKDDSGDTDTDTDADTDTDPPANIATYDGFVHEHAQQYCDALDSCGYLDDRGYATVQACVDDVSGYYNGQACEAYNVATARNCVQGDVDMAADCSSSPSGQEAPACHNVCAPPPAR
jgi:hypothetical protein